MPQFPFAFWKAAAAAGGTIVAGPAVSAGSSTGNSVTTGSIDTSGYSALFVWIAYDDFGGVPDLSDNKSNTWTANGSPLTIRSGSAIVKGQLYFCLGATVGSGHTFTATGSFNYPTIAVASFSGVATSSAFDSENGAGGTSLSSLQPGSITPSVNNELVILGLSLNNTDTPTDPSGYTRASGTAGDAANHIGGFIDYQIQTTATATNPNWTWSTPTIAAAGIACFKAA